MKTKNLRYVYDLGMYFAREDGEILDINGNVLTVYQDGSVRVISDFEGARRVPAHMLIATAFVPNPLELSFVYFKDGNKRNRHPSNLAWSNSKNRGIRHTKDPKPKVETVTKPADRIRLLHLEGLAVKEIAEQVGVSKMYVYRTVEKARQSALQ